MQGTNRSFGWLGHLPTLGAPVHSCGPVFRSFLESHDLRPDQAGRERRRACCRRNPWFQRQAADLQMASFGLRHRASSPALFSGG